LRRRDFDWQIAAKALLEQLDVMPPHYVTGERRFFTT
jgi:hypothetical protein